MIKNLIKRCLKKIVRKFIKPKFKVRKFHQVGIETITFCNFKCKMCPHNKLSIKGERIEVCEFIKRLEYLKPFIKDYTIISPIGLGEPFLHSEMNKLLRQIKIRYPNNIININTNGSREFYNKIDSLTSNDRVLISINHWDTYKHTINSGIEKSVLNRVINNTHEFLLLNNRPKVILQLINASRKEFNVFRKYWEPYIQNNDDIYNRPITNWGLGLGKDRKSIKRKPCLQLWIVIFLDIKGDVFPCCVSLAHPKHKEEMKLGHISNISLNSYEKKIKLLQKRHIKGEYPKICINCDIWREYLIYNLIYIN